ncbi:MAG: roadblock/LC7 domain-containing protein [Brasilonema sp.]
MNIDQIGVILKKFASNMIGFQGIALVNSGGKPITTIGMDDNAALIMAGTMIYLANRTRKEVQWEGIEQIEVKGTDGYVILTTCSPDIFLLVIANKVPEGMLLVEINRTVDKLKAVLKDEDSDSTGSNQTKLQESISEVTNKDGKVSHPLMYRGSKIPE